MLLVFSKNPNSNGQPPWREPPLSGMCKCAWAVNYHSTSNSLTTLPKSGVFHFVWHSRTNIRFLSSFQPPQTISRGRKREREWSPARNESSFGFWTVRKHRPPDYGPGCISTPPKYSGKKCSTLPGKVNVESSRVGKTRWMHSNTVQKENEPGGILQEKLHHTQCLRKMLASESGDLEHD